jgi:hypothetical protein
MSNQSIKKLPTYRLPYSNEKGLTTQELESALKQLMNRTPVKQYFVIGADQMKQLKITNYPAVVVQNCDPIALPGSHWICYFFVNSKEVEYFDSYGKNLYLYDYVEKPDARIIHANTKALQGWFSSLCSEFSLYFAYHRAIGLSYERIMSNFSFWSRVNERLVYQFYKTHVRESFKMEADKACQTCCTRNVNKLY